METDVDLEALVLEAGRAIRPYLRSLVGNDVKRIDDALARILDRKGLPGADRAILDLLDEQDGTHDWVSAFWRSGGIPPEVVRSMQPQLDTRTAEQRVRTAALGGGSSP